VRRLYADAEAARQRVSALQRPFKTYGVIETWQAQYTEDAHRCDMLCIVAPSKFGKSQLALSLGCNPYCHVVEDSPHPDLKNFDHTKHSHIVFDNVNNSDFVMRNRAKLQANLLMHTFAASGTNMYSYNRYLYRKPIVLTVDTSAKFDFEDGWIQANMRVLKLDAPSFLDA